MTKVTLEFFEAVAKDVQGGPWPNWNGLLTDRKRALAMFLNCYAFERAQRNPRYSLAAHDAVLEATALEPVSVWTEFRKKMGSVGLDENKNPLYHEGDCSGRKRCIICTLESRGAVRNILGLAKDLVENERVEEAHSFLKAIRGVGDKIASLFLRDLSGVYIFSPGRYRVLLQPIDVWVRRIANYQMTGEYDPEPVTSDLSIATWMASYSGSNNPELANFGMWLFGAKVIGRGKPELLREALGDRKRAEDLWVAYKGSDGSFSRS